MSKNNFEYVEVNAAIGNYEPTPPEKVHQVKRGDSKGLITKTFLSST